MTRQTPLPGSHASVWVDTDMGFDDLWALLLLRKMGLAVAGVSLVAGNMPLSGVLANALGARVAFGLTAPLYAGADRPLERSPETAEAILGPRGMRSRGRHLPDVPPEPLPAAVPALADWLSAPGSQDRCVLALGPLTNIARLLDEAPASAAAITRLVWMGGSSGAGNHSAAAEFNALADPHAAARVAQAGLPLDVVDLMICRQTDFGPADLCALPALPPLLADLLGGYLDIGLSRGRPGMAIYDPLAALAVACPDVVTFEGCTFAVSTTPGDSLGATRFAPDPGALTRLARATCPDAATLCLTSLIPEPDHAR